MKSAAVETLQPFLPRIRRCANAMEAARRLPADLAKDMAAAGLFRLLVPQSLGGEQVDPSTFIDTLIDASAADGSTGWNLMIGNTTGLLSASLPDPWAQSIYAARPDVVTVGVTAPRGRAIPERDGLRVSGRWPFGSGSHNADWICGGCHVVDQGEPRRLANGQPEVRLVFFRRDEVSLLDTWHVAGLRGTGSTDFEVHDVFVPEGRWVTLGGRPRIDAPLYRFPTLGLLATGVASVAVGIARRAIAEFLELAAGKVPTGSTLALASRPRVQQDLAEAEAGTSAAICFMHATAQDLFDRAARGERLATSDKARLRLAASHATWSSVSAVDKLYHAAGATSIYEGSALQRCLRDIHVATQHIMVGQSTFEVAGKVMLGIDPQTLL
ncbi:MAG: hypothetical protein H6993_18180 [Pseudomonadales bacterium]|nr:hypothetical protein [Pseudomonadales bacterium]MCP5185899.1 hypothetical protein [Pseudomonadales bacterium]